MTSGSASPLLATRSGLPRTGRAQSPAAGAHGQSAAPRCRRDTRTPGTAWGCQHGPWGRMDPPAPPVTVGGGGRQQAGAGAARRGVPALARRRGRSLKGLKDARGRAARRRMLTPMGLTVASAAPSITRRREPSLPRPPRPLSGLPPGRQAPRSVHRQGVPCPSVPPPPCSPRCRRAERTNTGPVPGPGGAAGKMVKPPPPSLGPAAGGMEQGEDRSRSPRGSTRLERPGLGGRQRDRGARLCPTAFPHVAT